MGQLDLSPLWAKQSGHESRYPLSCHLLDTATVAQILWDEWLRSWLKELLTTQLGARAREIIAYSCGIHDIGKASPVFAMRLADSYRREWVPEARVELQAAGFWRPSGRDYGLGGSAGWRSRALLHRHEQVSAMVLKKDSLAGQTEIGSEWLAVSALGHHGTFNLDTDEHSIETLKSITAGAWSDSWQLLREQLSEALGIRETEFPERISQVAVMLISGLTVLADRIASTDLSVSGGYQQLKLTGGKLPDPSSWVAVRWAQLRQVVQQTVGIYEDFTDANAAILGEYQPNSLQEQAVQLDEGLWLAMAPTGFGKTEAALLRHSRRAERLLFLLPTQATSNALLRRLHRHYRDTANVASLAHGLASLEDFYRQPLTTFGSDKENGPNGDAPAGLHPQDFVKSGSARLLAPVCVGTIDQALMASLPNKWTHLRLLALANAHVVIDEAHTMEEYQTALVEPLFTWWGMTGTRVSVLTATLPTGQRDQFIDAYRNAKGGVNPVPSEYPPAAFPSSVVIAGGTTQHRELATKPYRIALTYRSAEDPVSAHLEWHRHLRGRFPQARLGIIVNTIGRAQEVGKQLLLTGEPVLMLHSRMTAEHRRVVGKQLEELLGRGGGGTGLTVIGTQAIEASLDIDLDMMSTDLAPAPSLIQRAGRVWRHDDRSRATTSGRIPGVDHLPLHIVRGEGAFTSLPYFQAALDRTWRFLEGRASLEIPSDSQNFVDASAMTLMDVDGDSAADQEEFLKRLDELGYVSLKIGAAKNCRIDLDRVDSDILTIYSIGNFAKMPEGADPKATRYIERESSRVILIGDLIGGWQGSVSQLNAIRPEEKESLSRALRASVSLSDALLHKVKANVVSLEPKAAALIGCSAVEMGDGLRYDETLGLVIE